MRESLALFRPMIHFFLKRPKLGFLMSLILVVAGLFAMSSLRKESYPNVNFASAVITTIYPGAAPGDVEELVTQKIEDELRGIDGLKEVRSVSQNGRSEIKIQVDLDKADVPLVMDEIQRATQRVTDLPKEVEDLPLFQEIKTKNLPVLEIAVFGNAPELEMRRVADRLKDQLENHPGVAGIDLVGYRDREFRVFLDPIKMAKEHIGFQEVVQALQNRNLDLPGGIFESRPQEMTIRTVGELKQPDDLKDTVIRTNLSGKQVYLKDLATIEDSFEDAQVFARFNGQRAMLLVIKKKEFADIITLNDSLKEKVESFAPQSAPRPRLGHFE